MQSRACIWILDRHPAEVDDRRPPDWFGFVLDILDVACPISEPGQRNTLKLILTDVQMPGRFNGIEFSKYIGEHWPDISIIVASGAVIPEERALPTHARFLNKPITKNLF